MERNSKISIFLNTIKRQLVIIEVIPTACEIIGIGSELHTVTVNQNRFDINCCVGALERRH